MFNYNCVNMASVHFLSVINKYLYQNLNKTQEIQCRLFSGEFVKKQCIQCLTTSIQEMKHFIFSSLTLFNTVYTVDPYHDLAGCFNTGLPTPSATKDGPNRPTK